MPARARKRRTTRRHPDGLNNLTPEIIAKGHQALADAGHKRRQRVMQRIIEGLTLEQAALAEGLSASTVQQWLKKYPDWKAAYQAVLADRKFVLCDLDFETFCTEVLGQAAPDHTKPWREAADDPAIESLLILVPPGHTKTQLMSIRRAAWRLARDRNVRLARMSSGEEFAEKILIGVRQILMDSAMYPGMDEFRPFDSVDLPWRADRMYVAGYDASHSHSPSLEAKGLGSQIYGDRFHEFVLDDIADTRTNTPGAIARAKSVIRQDVFSRMPYGDSKLIVVGTRVGQPDVYSELIAENFFDHVIVTPALDEGGRPLWRRRWLVEKKHKEKLNDPAYVANPELDVEIAEVIEKTKVKVTPHLWALQYQQSPASDEDAVFPWQVLEDAQDPSLRIRDIRQEAWKRRLRLVAGFDPAPSGWAVIVILGIDIKTGQRIVVDVLREKNVTTSKLVDFAKEAIDLWQPERMIVENKAFQQLLVEHPALQAHARQRRCVIGTHDTTGKTKHDPNFGVSALAELFYEKKVTVPWGDQPSKERFQVFLTELNYWRAYDNKVTQDQVMAFWFADKAARTVLEERRDRQTTHRVKGRNAMPSRLASQTWRWSEPTPIDADEVVPV